MIDLNRREFIGYAGTAGIAWGILSMCPPGTVKAQVPKRKMTMNLVCGAIGVSANQREAIDLAARHGFESVEANGAYLASLADDQLRELKEFMKQKGIEFGAAGLPVDFRQDETRFAEGIKGLPKIAAGLQRAGVYRMSTWIMPCHDTLTYLANFRQHAARLREVARILQDHRIRLGLEYVGPKTLWSSKRYPFLHTMAETKDLMLEIGIPNLGFQLDSWHWWNAGETEADLLSLTPEQVVVVDINDAPAGIARDQQVDNRRELPCATGVIDIAAFMNALNRIGYDGPVRAEPFNKALNALPKEEAVAATAKAVKQAFATVRSIP